MLVMYPVIVFYGADRRDSEAAASLQHGVPAAVRSLHRLDAASIRSTSAAASFAASARIFEVSERFRGQRLRRCASPR